MTKKVLKIFSLVLAVVMIASLFAGCSLFQLNQERYREEVAFTVGDTTITVGDFIDFYANTMTQYIGEEYDVQTVWDQLGKQLLINYIVLDMIKKDSTWTKVEQNAPYNMIAAEYTEAQYLQNADDMEILLKNVRNSLYVSLNTLVDTELSNKYTLEDASTEEERKLNIQDNYNIYLGALTDADYNEDIEEVEKNLEAYKPCDLSNFQNIIDTYVYDEGSDLLTAAVNKINERVTQDEGVEEDDEDFKAITAQEYVSAQKAALSSLTRSVKTNYYGWTMVQFLKYQLKSTISGRLVQQYAIKEYKVIESNVVERLNAKLQNMVEIKREYYQVHPSKFVEDIKALDASSYIYTVPAQYVGKFVFVKNMLVQFTEEQTAALKQYEQFGKSSKAYLDYRNQLATQIAATDYTSQQDLEGEYTGKVENIFKLEGGEVVLNDTILKTSLEAMAANINQRNKDFDKIIDKYNEDPGMQGKTYDYVLRVEKPDTAGTADNWVAEFSAAGRKAVANGVGSYEIAVTDYGVHIVYFSGYVTADNFDFNNQQELYTTNTATYRFFREYYDAIKADIYDDQFNAIIDKYFEDGKITMNSKNLKKLLKEYGFEIKWQI